MLNHLNQIQQLLLRWPEVSESATLQITVYNFLHLAEE